MPDRCVLSEYGSNSRSAAQTKEQRGTRHGGGQEQEGEQEHAQEHEHVDEQKQPRGAPGRTKIAASPASTSNGTWLGIAVCGSSSSPIFSLYPEAMGILRVWPGASGRM